MNLQLGSRGDEVLWLQRALYAHGLQPGAIDGDFGPKTQRAVIAFQKAHGLTPDGIVGPVTRARLDREHNHQYQPGDVSVNTVRAITRAPENNLVRFLPHVINGLRHFGLADKQMVAYALGTIVCETWGGSFVPSDERPSRYSGPNFENYEMTPRLGNTKPGDGAKFRGRGFIQITGRFNYERYGDMIGKRDTLLRDPDKANDPATAGLLLGAYLKDNEREIRLQLTQGRMRDARAVVNGRAALHWETLRDVYKRAMQLLPEVRAN